MPMIDMPLEQLKKYKGTNPKPQGFDAYWDKQIEMIENTQFPWILKDHSYAAPHLDCKELFYKGIDGADIYAKFLCPGGLHGEHAKIPLILAFHGYTGESSTWLELSSFCALGFAVLAMDCRGQGGKSSDPGIGHHSPASATVSGHIIAGIFNELDDLYYRKVFLDTAILAKIGASFPNIDSERIITYGGSQGGALSLICAALSPYVTGCVSLYPFLSDYRRVWEMDLDTDAYEGLRYLFKHFDPEHKNENDIFEKLGYIDVKNFASRITGDCIIGTGLIDTICPPSTQFAIVNNLGTPDAGRSSIRKHILYPDFTHERIPAFLDSVYEYLFSLYSL